jgi:5'(3')-deoxyribonucleotidase
MIDIKQDEQKISTGNLIEIKIKDHNVSQRAKHKEAQIVTVLFKNRVTKTATTIITKLSHKFNLYIVIELGQLSFDIITNVT